MSLFVREFGPVDGPPVLALHGPSAHGARFADLAARLPAYRIIAPDLRGHGRSPALPPWGLSQQVDDLLDVLDARDLGRLPVLGHSLGGVLALRLAERAPARVNRLLLLDPGTGMSPEKALRNADQLLDESSYASAEEARADRIAHGWAELPTAYVDTEIAEHLERRADGRWHWRCRRPALIGLLGELTLPVPVPPADLPTLLVVARRADVVRPDWRRACAARLGDHLVVRELDCGHGLYYERPAQTAATVAGFLGRRPGTGPAPTTHS